MQLRVHDQQPLRFLHHEELQEPRGRELSDLVKLTRARKKEQQAEVLTPEEALARFRRIVVPGDPGPVWDPDSALFALPQVCKSARVRVFPDGRVEMSEGYGSRRTPQL